ncbi:MAG: FliM/FliN family flagellar motor switch protein [Myxococcota bacterium]
MTEDLKQSIAMPLVVELARLPLNLQQIGALQTGQVVELKKTSGEPVELTISGKSIGQGELVEVEGKLGVKVLSLIGA